MKSREWLLNQLGMTSEELQSGRRGKNTAKRWVVMWFYRAAGKSYPYIGRKTGHDQLSVRYGCINAPQTIKMLAEEYLRRYITEVLHETPSFAPTLPEEKPKTFIKIPDYKTSQVITKEVDIDDVKKPIKQVWNDKRWDR